MQKIRKYYWVNFDKNYKDQDVWIKLKPVIYGSRKGVVFALGAYKIQKIHFQIFKLINCSLF